MEGVFSRFTNLFLLLLFVLSTTISIQEANAGPDLNCSFTFKKDGATVSANNLTGTVKVSVSHQWAYTAESKGISVGSTVLCRSFSDCTFKTTDFQNGNQTIKCFASSSEAPLGDDYDTASISINNPTPQVSLSLLKETRKKFIFKATVDFPGAIKHVKFTRDGGNGKTDSTRPYKFAVIKHTLSAGPHTIEAVAVARGSNAEGRDSMNIVKDPDPHGDDDDDGGNPDDTPPDPITIALSFPDQDADNLSGRATLLAVPSDKKDVSRMRVAFTNKRGKTKLKTDARSPYKFRIPTRLLEDGENIFTVTAYHGRDHVLGESQISGTVDNSPAVQDKVVYQMGNPCNLSAGARWSYLRGDKTELSNNGGCGLLLEPGRRATKGIRGEYHKTIIKLKMPSTMKAGDKVSIDAYLKRDRGGSVFTLKGLTLQFKATSAHLDGLLGKLTLGNKSTDAWIPLGATVTFHIERSSQGDTLKTTGSIYDESQLLRTIRTIVLEERNTHSKRNYQGSIGATSSVPGTLITGATVKKTVRKKR